MRKPLVALLVMTLFGATPSGTATPAAGALAAPYTALGFDLLRELHAGNPNGNVFISPTSIAIALAMLANGAEGTTRAAILKTIHASQLSTDALNTANTALRTEIAQTTTVQISTANALWLQTGFTPNPGFSKTLSGAYGAQVANLDFRQNGAEAVKTINAWAAQHTHDRIQKILDQVDPSTVLMLANAIAFKGKWTLPFNAHTARSHDFTTSAGDVRQVQMMQNSDQYAYENANGLEAIRLPYGDQSFAMYVVLARDAKTMQTFLTGLTPEYFDSLRTALSTRHGTIELPRFTIEYDTTLNTELAKLGMGEAFSDHANFDGIHQSPPQLAVSEVRHASFLKVDEEGTEAAAVTSIGMKALAVAPGPPPFHMVVDRPFWLGIRDEQTGQMLFTGVINAPE